MARTKGQLIANELSRKRRKRVLRKRVQQYLTEQGCKDCGEADPTVLDFDHRCRTAKHAPIADMVAWAYAWDTVWEEMQKCDVRCANCHRRRTSKQLGWHARAKR